MTNSKKRNYLNNKDLLKEIHLSKNSYCSFLNPVTDHQFDIILNDVSEITQENIDKALESRKTRLEKEKLDVSNIQKTDLVFRVMTWEHIPAAPVKPAKKSKTKTLNISDEFKDFEENFSDSELDEVEADLIDKNDPTLLNKAKIKVNFPPFFHYRFNDQDELILVGKSQWQGDLVTGSFCKTHGQITDNLALMYMKLTERWGSRSNYRGYSYLDEMVGQGLAQLIAVGLQFNEAKSDNPFSYFSMCLQNAFCRVLNIEKRNQNVRDSLLEQSGFKPSMSRQMQNLD
jgi:hypothetical protein